MRKKDLVVPVQLLAFTFFYAVAIYLLMVGFLYWFSDKDRD